MSDQDSSKEQGEHPMSTRDSARGKPHCGKTIFSRKRSEKYVQVVEKEEDTHGGGW